jgi:hypothetical protein
MQRIATALLILALMQIAATGQSGNREMPPDFKSDGCSLFPDGNYHDCCVQHDQTYYFGGSLKERRAADKALYKCVRSKGNSKLLASMIYMGVRVGGVSFLPTPFRWGFGNKFPRKEPKRPKSRKLPTDH